MNLLKLSDAQIAVYWDALLRGQQRELGGHLNALVTAQRGQSAGARRAALIWALAALARIQPSLPMRTWLPDLPPHEDAAMRVFVLSLGKPANLWSTQPEYTLEDFFACAQELAALQCSPPNSPVAARSAPSARSSRSGAPWKAPLGS